MRELHKRRLGSALQVRILTAREPTLVSVSRLVTPRCLHALQSALTCSGVAAAVAPLACAHARLTRTTGGMTTAPAVGLVYVRMVACAGDKP